MNIKDKENSAKKKLFLQIQSIDIVYPNRESMIVVPKNKKYENLSLTHSTNELWLSGKWWKEKPFLLNQSINIVYPNVNNMIVMANHKKN